MKVDRIRNCLGAESFRRSTFTPLERCRAAAASNPATAFAVCFAAKEAVFKALRLAPDEIAAWTTIEILQTDAGVVSVTLHGRAVDVEITQLPAPEGHVLCVARARKEHGR